MDRLIDKFEEDLNTLKSDFSGIKMAVLNILANGEEDASKKEG
tara:strand:+ start:244 stop:372 length:129 start_codon:yes stop_codon:yes gene_type:complete